MPTSYSPLLGLALPVTGELSGTWGDTVNDYITKYLDSSVAGTQTISGSQTAVTLSVTNGTTLVQVGSGATGSAQYQVINCTGNPASLLTVTVPAQSKTYVVVNATSTSQQVKIVGVGPTTGVTLDAGEKAVVAWNGSDFIKVATSTVDGVSTISFGTTGLTPSTATSGAVTVAGTLVAANGGTGQSTYTTGDLLYATGSTALSKLGIGTNGQVLTSTGTAPQWSTLSGVAVTTFSAGTTGFTPSSATSGAITLAGTLATTNGGTGLTSFTANRVFYASSTSAIGQSANLTFDGTTLTAANFTDSSLTSGRVTYATTGGNLTDSANLTFDGSKLTVKGGNGGQLVLDNGGQQFVQQVFQINGAANSGGDFTFDGTNSVFNMRTLAVAPIVFSISASAGNPAEAMRLTSTGLGIGTSSPGYKLDVRGSTGLIVGWSDGTTIGGLYSGGGYIGLTNSTAANGFFVNPTGVFCTIATGGAERARIDSSGNLGIGTSSPDQALVVNKASGSTYVKVSGPNNVNNDLALHFTDGTNNAYFGMMRGTSGGVAGALHSYTGGAIRSTLDSSGNLGLGVTPSAWSSSRALQILSTSLYNNTANDTFLGSNFYYDGSNNRYINTDFAAAYGQVDGTHRWYTAASGTAGNTISFSQVMTLDASGNLGIGTTSPGQPLVVSKNQNGSTWAQVSNTTSGTGAAAGLLLTSDSSIQATVELDSSTYTSFANMLRIRQIGAYPIGFLTSDTERMRLDANGSLGIGTTSPGARLDVSGTSGGIVYVRGTGDAYQEIAGGSRTPGTGSLLVGQGNAGEGYLWNRFNSYLAFGLNNAEAMRLTSTGLGIGTSSPTQKLTVSGSATFSRFGINSNPIDTASTAQSFVRFATTGADFYLGTESSTSGGFFPSSTAYAAVLYNANATPMQFYTNGSLRATLDSSGNLGIGTSSPTQKLDVRGVGSFGNGTIANLIGQDGANAYVGTANSYPLALYTNGAIRALIDSSGNLGLGVTPSAWSSSFKALQVGKGVVSTNADTAVYLGVNWVNESGGDKYITTGPASVYSQFNGAHTWYTAASGTAGNAISFTQAMTLDASGRLLLGTTSAYYAASGRGEINLNASSDNIFGFLIGGNPYAYIYTSSSEFRLANTASIPTTFYTNGTECARITSGGDLLVGTTDSSATSGNGFKFIPGTGATCRIVGSADTNANFAHTVYSTSPAAYRFQVGWGGTIYATSTSISAISDQTLKTNVRDLETGLTEVMALKPRRFDWINGDGTNVAGFVAQEVEQVLPELVGDYLYSHDENGNDIIKKSLKMGDILPTLVKAVQELKAELDTVKAELATLKGN